MNAKGWMNMDKWINGLKNLMDDESDGCRCAQYLFIIKIKKRHRFIFS